MDGRLAILDWSLVGTLGVRRTRRHRADHARRDHARRRPHRDGADGIGRRDQPARSTRRYERSLTAAGSSRVRRGQFPGLSWLVGMLDASVQEAGLRFPAGHDAVPQIAAYARGRGADVGGCGGQIDQTLSLEFLRHFARRMAPALAAACRIPAILPRGSRTST